MRKRDLFCYAVKNVMPVKFSSKDLYSYLVSVGCKISYHETSRYIYRFKQMGFITHVGYCSNAHHLSKLWSCTNLNFTTKGRMKGITALVKRAVAASNNEFYLRQFKKTISKYPREEVATVFCKMRKNHKLLAQKSLFKNVNIYFKPL